MSARLEIERLTAAGEPAAAVARATGRSLRWVQAVRRELRQQTEHGTQRALAAEEIPVRPPAVRRHPWTPAEQTRHRAELLAALRSDPG